MVTHTCSTGVKLPVYSFSNRLRTKSISPMTSLVVSSCLLILCLTKAVTSLPLSQEKLATLDSASQLQTNQGTSPSDYSSSANKILASADKGEVEAKRDLKLKEEDNAVDASDTERLKGKSSSKKPSFSEPAVQLTVLEAKTPFGDDQEDQGKSTKLTTKGEELTLKKGAKLKSNSGKKDSVLTSSLSSQTKLGSQDSKSSSSSDTTEAYDQYYYYYYDIDDANLIGGLSGHYAYYFDTGSNSVKRVALVGAGKSSGKATDEKTEEKFSVISNPEDDDDSGFEKEKLGKLAKQKVLNEEKSQNENNVEEEYEKPVEDFLKDNYEPTRKAEKTKVNEKTWTSNFHASGGKSSETKQSKPKDGNKEESSEKEEGTKEVKEKSEETNNMVQETSTVSEDLEILTEGPKTMTSEPKIPTEDPEILTEQPDSLTEQPDSLTEQPDSVTERPDSVTEQPDSVTEQPDSLTEQPEILTEQPDSLTEQPDSLTEQPETTSTQTEDVPTEKPETVETPKEENIIIQPQSTQTDAITDVETTLELERMENSVLNNQINVPGDDGKEEEEEKTNNDMSFPLKSMGLENSDRDNLITTYARAVGDLSTSNKNESRSEENSKDVDLIEETPEALTAVDSFSEGQNMNESKSMAGNCSTCISANSSVTEINNDTIKQNYTETKIENATISSQSGLGKNASDLTTRVNLENLTLAPTEVSMMSTKDISSEEKGEETLKVPGWVRALAGNSTEENVTQNSTTSPEFNDTQSAEEITPNGNSSITPNGNFSITPNKNISVTQNESLSVEIKSSGNITGTTKMPNSEITEIPPIQEEVSTDNSSVAKDLSVEELRNQKNPISKTALDTANTPPLAQTNDTTSEVVSNSSIDKIEEENLSERVLNIITDTLASLNASRLPSATKAPTDFLDNGTTVDVIGATTRNSSQNSSIDEPKVQNDSGLKNISLQQQANKSIEEHTGDTGSDNTTDVDTDISAVSNSNSNSSSTNDSNSSIITINSSDNSNSNSSSSNDSSSIIITISSNDNSNSSSNNTDDATVVKDKPNMDDQDPEVQLSQETSRSINSSDVEEPRTLDVNASGSNLTQNLTDLDTPQQSVLRNLSQDVAGNVNQTSIIQTQNATEVNGTGPAQSLNNTKTKEAMANSTTTTEKTSSIKTTTTDTVLQVGALQESNVSNPNEEKVRNHDNGSENVTITTTTDAMMMLPLNLTAEGMMGTQANNNSTIDVNTTKNQTEEADGSSHGDVTAPMTTERPEGAKRVARSADKAVPPISSYMIQDFSLNKPPSYVMGNGGSSDDDTSTSGEFGMPANDSAPCPNNCGVPLMEPPPQAQAAVSAVLTSHFGPTKDQIIPFDLVLLDLAENYDNSTGMFICTIPGTYVISLYLMSHPGAKVNARVFINNRPIAALWADDAKSAGFYPSSSTQTIAQLGFGDQVYIMLVDGGYGESWVHANYNVFTVFLLYEQLF